MASNSRAAHINTRHINESAASLNAIFNAELFIDCPFPDCRTKHTIRGLNTHITKKHPGYLIPLHPAPLPIPPVLHHQQPPPPLNHPPLPQIPAEFLVAIGDVVDGALQLEAAVEAIAIQEPAAAALVAVVIAAAPVPMVAPVAAPALPFQPPPEVDLGVLVARFRFGLYKFHPTWKEPLRTLTTSLLNASQSPQPLSAARSIAAFQLLPGLLEFARRKHKSIPTPITLLRTLLACPDHTAEIVRVATTWYHTFRPRPTPVYQPPNKEKLRARIELLVSQSRLSQAAQLSRSLATLLEGVDPPPPPDPTLMTASIARLHPIDDDRDVLPNASDDPIECLQLTPDQTRQRIYKLNCDSSSGSTGWTNILLRHLLDDRVDNSLRIADTPPLPIHIAITSLFNRMLRGEISGPGRDLLVTARLIMIPKGPASFRPLRIECAIIRLFSSIACDSARLLVSPGLRPQQLGGGLSGGVEFGARLLDVGYDQGDTIISIDVENAFNSLRHSYAYSELLDKAPSIARLFRWKYGTPSVMRDNLGAVVAHTRTGVGQGDPLSSIFFALGLQPVLHRLTDTVRALETAHNLSHPNAPVARPGLVSAYEDDTSVRGETAIMFSLAPLIAPIFAEFGLTVKQEKSFICGKDTDTAADPPDNFVIEADGITTLGVPIGAPHFRTPRSVAMLTAMAPPTRALSLLTPRSSLLLLHKCFTGRPSFLMRTTSDYAALRPAAALFDIEICNCVAAILELEISTNLKSRIFLPRRNGGLGLNRLDGMRSEKNQMASRFAFQDFISTVYPLDYLYTQQHHNLYWNPIRFGESEDLAEHTDLTEDMIASMSHANCKAMLSTAFKTASTKQAELYHTSLTILPTSQQLAAWFLSSSISSSAFITSTTGIDSDKYFPSSDFICAVRAFLGYGHTNVLSTIPQACCLCGMLVTASSEPLHCMTCNVHAGSRTYRHDEIRDCFVRLLRKIYPHNMITTEALVGRTVPNAHGVTKEVFSDVTLVLGAETLIIDFAVVCPGGAHYLQYPTRSAITQDGAALHKEVSKRRHYATVAPPDTPPPNSVIPFVLEASGRLGPSALGFLHRICPTQTYLRTRFLHDVSFICARTTGRILRTSRDRERWLPLNGGQVPIHG